MSDRRFSIRISLRLKIILLLTIALSASMGSYLYYGSDLLATDKLSYIYENKSSLAKAAGSAIDVRLENAGALISLFGAQAPESPEAEERLQDIYQKEAQRLGLLGVVSFSYDKGEQLLLERTINIPKENLEATLKLLKWDANSLAADHLALAPYKRDSLAIGKLVRSGTAAPTFAIALLHFNRAMLSKVGSNADVQVFDKTANALLAESTDLPIITSTQKEDIKALFVDKNLQSGVRKWGFKGGEYLAAYQKTGLNNLLLVSFTPVEAALVAARALMIRSLLAGICVLLIAIGMSSFLIKALLWRVQNLWIATNALAEGNLEARVAGHGKVRDEITDLGKSFNEMADRISLLMKETADKVRMEKELETAQALQNGFFPAAAFIHPNVIVSGIYQPASECAGDWWGYDTNGEHLFIFVGDVTGHGAASALVTAAAHAVFHHVFNDARLTGAKVSLPSLLRQLNSTIFSIGLGELTMSFLAIDLNLNSGHAKMVNAGHPFPILGSFTQASPAGVSVKSLVSEPQLSLGQEKAFAAKEIDFKFKAGDRIALFTDGFFEPRISDGKKVSKRTFLEIVSRAFNLPEGGRAPAESIMGQALAHLEVSGGLRDDITLVVAEIPRAASFQ